MLLVLDVVRVAAVDDQVARFASRQDDSPAMKVVAALRNQFGGHAVTAFGTDPSST